MSQIVEHLENSNVENRYYFFQIKTRLFFITLLTTRPEGFEPPTNLVPETSALSS